MSQMEFVRSKIWMLAQVCGLYAGCGCGWVADPWILLLSHRLTDATFVGYQDHTEARS